MNRRDFLKFSGMASATFKIGSIAEPSNGTFLIKDFSGFIPARKSEKQSASNPDLTSDIVTPLVIPLTVKHSIYFTVSYVVSDTWGSTRVFEVRVQCLDQSGNLTLLRSAHTSLFIPQNQTQSNDASLTFANASFEQIGVQPISLIWDVKDNDGNWKTIGRSKHILYVIADQPNSPWTNSKKAQGLCNVWTDVLDIACKWAEGAKDSISAASKIVDALYIYAQQTASDNASASVFTYDSNAGASNFAPSYYYDPLQNIVYVDEFYLTDFIQRIVNKGGVRGPNINCYDCSNAVRILANALGANLEEIDLYAIGEAQSFPVRDVKLIGQKTVTTTTFISHSVAGIVGPTKSISDSYVFDACLSIKGNNCPKNMLMETYLNTISDPKTIYVEFRTHPFRAIVHPILGHESD